MSELHGMTLPTCDISVNGQKRKLYGKNKNKVYLHNGDNFQLKFFNPLQERIGVQLSMNGIKVDNDLLVLNPGQEITIERFIGTNRKLTFSAYDIDTKGMSEERVEQAVKAIEKNGVLEVTFWNEKKSVPIIYTSSSTVYPNIYTNKSPNWFGISGSTTSNVSTGTNSPATNLTINGNGDVVITGNLKINGTLDINNGQLKVSGQYGTTGSSGTSGMAGTSGTRGTSLPNFSGNDSFALYDYAPEEKYRGILCTGNITSGNYNQPVQQLSKKLETGRIEKGGVSNQYFSPIVFEVGEPFYKIKFKLLPFSLKPVKKKLYDSTTIKNIIDGNTSNTYMRNESAVREYCEKCGYRISRGKGQWKKCPMCGKKIS